MAKKTSEDIQRKRDNKLQEIMKTKGYELRKNIEKVRTDIYERTELELERKFEKLKRKMNAYINKKRIEYDRKCKNEIRKLQGKEEKQYKPKKPTRQRKLKFALEIAQENARLRDTNQNGY